MAGRTGRYPCLCYPIFDAEKENNMTYTVQVKVMPLKDLLDPQGKAVMGGLQSLGISNVNDVRIGKNITLQVNADSPENAKAVAEEASKKLLSNPVMEYFEISVN
jgi:phosphoribosylformylglycinamidine synthase